MTYTVDWHIFFILYDIHCSIRTKRAREKKLQFLSKNVKITGKKTMKEIMRVINVRGRSKRLLTTTELIAQ